KMAAIAGELILDRILDRHYMPHQVLVHPLQEGRYGGGFPGAGRSGHKNQAVLTSAPSGQEPFGRSERVQAGHPGFDATQDSAETAHGAVQVHAIARMCARDEAAVAIHVTVAISIRTARLPEGRYVYE